LTLRRADCRCWRLWHIVRGTQATSLGLRAEQRPKEDWSLSTSLAGNGGTNRRTVDWLAHFGSSLRSPQSRSESLLHLGDPRSSEPETTMQNGDADAEPYKFKSSIKSIAIIGAGTLLSHAHHLTSGSCGIVMAKAALAQGFTSITIFEQRSDIGGAWSQIPKKPKVLTVGCIPARLDRHVVSPVSMRSTLTGPSREHRRPLSRPCIPIYLPIRHGIS